jgi:hypothetical protein
MSIVLSPNICQSTNCSSLIFKDGTGAYSINNTSGYGAPNESIAGASAYLIVTLSDGTSTTINITASGFPTTDTTLEYQIDADDIGYNVGDKIEDQIITIQYRVVTALTTIIVQTIQTALYCQVNCCVNSMFIDLDLECEDCLKTLGARAEKAHLMLQGLKYAANCLDTTTFNKTLTQLNKLCNNSECSNCG